MRVGKDQNSKTNFVAAAAQTNAKKSFAKTIKTCQSPQQSVSEIMIGGLLCEPVYSERLA